MKGAPRKLRKSCSLATCSKTPGECMHCTCDGRCGQHDAGHCGVRREGNGKGCKRDGCLRDESCLHSTRATCCHCRNLVSSSNRTSRKRTRAASTGVIAVTAPVPKAVAAHENRVDDDGVNSPTSCDGRMPLTTADVFADIDLCDEILCKKQKIDTAVEDVTVVTLESEPTDANTNTYTNETPTDAKVEDQPVEADATKPLCEYTPWASRRATCNLVVVVEGTQFNLHKHPMLLESQLLNAKARESVVASRAAVPVLQLSYFPGGAPAFEALCVYAYTGELHVTTPLAAAIYVGVHYLNMGLDAKTKARAFLTGLTTSSTTLHRLLQVTQSAMELVSTPPSMVDVCQELQMECLDAVARLLPLERHAIASILALPGDLFLQITQEMLATRGSPDLAMDAVRQLCVQAELAQIRRECLETNDTTAAQRCLDVLTQSLSTGRGPSAVHVSASAAASLATMEEDDDDTLFMKMMYDFELEPTSDVEVDGSFTDMLSFEPLAFASSRGMASGGHRLLTETFAI